MLPRGWRWVRPAVAGVSATNHAQFCGNKHRGTSTTTHEACCVPRIPVSHAVLCSRCRSLAVCLRRLTKIRPSPGQPPSSASCPQLASAQAPTRTGPVPHAGPVRVRARSGATSACVAAAGSLLRAAARRVLDEFAPAAVVGALGHRRLLSHPAPPYSAYYWRHWQRLSPFAERRLERTRVWYSHGCSLTRRTESGGRTRPHGRTWPARAAGLALLLGPHRQSPPWRRARGRCCRWQTRQMHLPPAGRLCHRRVPARLRPPRFRLRRPQLLRLVAVPRRRQRRLRRRHLAAAAVLAVVVAAAAPVWAPVQ